MSASERDRAESIRQRIRNRMRERGEDVQFGLQRYAIERFLYRLGASAHRERFVLKGATLFALWGGNLYRPTRDVDFTGYGSAEEADVLDALRSICREPGEPSELIFEPDSMRAEQIRDDSEYQGLRIRFQAQLGASRIPLQIDIGFANAIEPPPQEAEYPTLLDDPAPKIRTYPREAVVAEKLHAMVVLGERNSRYKDFYDLYVLAQQFPFEGAELARAAVATFNRRSTPIEATLPVALTPRFYADDTRAMQWRTYLTGKNLPGAPAYFAPVGEQIIAFLGSLWSQLAADAESFSDWLPAGPWGTSTMSEASEAVERVKLRRFKPYQDYKDTGSKWMEEIPRRWEVISLKRVASIRYGLGEPPRLLSDGLPFIRATNVTKGCVVERDLQFVDPDDVPWNREPALRAGDIVVVRSGAYTGDSAIIPDKYDGAIAGYDMVVRCRRGEARFLAWTLLSPYTLEAQIELKSTRAAQPHLNAEELGGVLVFFPPDAEQRAIAAFLDRETAKIDALVAKKERLIELLQEKRSALISDCVTGKVQIKAECGRMKDEEGHSAFILHPSSLPTKDSGVEWLGEIPAHWEVTPLKRLLRRSDYGTSESLTGGGDVRVLTMAHIQGGEVVLPEKGSVNHVEDVLVLENGDLLFNRTNSRELVGKVGLFRGSRDDRVTFASYLVRMTGRGSVVSEWLNYLLNSAGVLGLARSMALLSVNQANLNPTKYTQIAVPLPPGSEQRAIATFLDCRTARIDALIAKIREAIDRLKELRIALISASVTGKIDVREEVA